MIHLAASLVALVVILIAAMCAFAVVCSIIGWIVGEVKQLGTDINRAFGWK